MSDFGAFRTELCRNSNGHSPFPRQLNRVMNGSPSRPQPTSLRGKGRVASVPHHFPEPGMSAAIRPFSPSSLFSYKSGTADADAGGDCQLQIFEGCEHLWVDKAAPMTDKAHEMVKSFIGRVGRLRRAA